MAYRVYASGVNNSDGSEVRGTFPGGAATYACVKVAGHNVKTCREHKANLERDYPGTTWKAWREKV